MAFVAPIDEAIVKKAAAVGAALAVVVILIALVARGFVPGAATSPAAVPASEEAHESLLFGQVTTLDGAVYEGRLRWGRNEEALWSHYFDGFKDENPWAAHVPTARLPAERLSIRIFGFHLSGWEQPASLGRPFMARFGDLVRIEPRGRDLWVTLKSGTVVRLDRFEADDMNDGVRVWDDSRGVVDLGEWWIRSIEFLPGAPRRAGSLPLHGTVRTRHGDFVGLVQWDRQEGLGSDVLDGHDAGRRVRLRFDAIRAVARHSRDSSLVTLRDGREMVLTGTRKVGRGHRGIYVDDRRYGRVLISWDAFERIDFDQRGAGPAYSDFAPGHALTGSVTTRSGRRLSGRLVYDLDESETTETLDARRDGVDYTLPFALVASIALPGLEARGVQHATVTLRSGETLPLELTGDLGQGNAGMLVFDGRPRPEYVPWRDVARVDFEPPPGAHAPGSHR